MQLKAESIYLEEELTKHVEFPTDGKFYGRFQVNGDPAEEVDANVESIFDSLVPFSQEQEPGTTIGQSVMVMESKNYGRH